MLKLLFFKSFCLETYKQAYNMSGSDVLEEFNKYDVFNYLALFSDCLYNHSQQYILEDISLLINAWKNAELDALDETDKSCPEIVELYRKKKPRQGIQQNL